MNNGTHGQKSIKSPAPLELVTHAIEDGFELSKEKLDDVKERLDDVRARADIVVHERPMLVAAAVGLVGLGIGYLVAHRVERWLVMGIGGAALSAFFAPTLKVLKGRVEATAGRLREA